MEEEMLRSSSNFDNISGSCSRHVYLLFEESTVWISRIIHQIIGLVWPTILLEQMIWTKFSHCIIFC